jgi:hypothetical protein
LVWSIQGSERVRAHFAVVESPANARTRCGEEGKRGIKIAPDFAWRQCEALRREEQQES